MIKQNWNIDDNERFRILNLHESATKNLYLLNEQDPFKKTIISKADSKKIALGSQTFPSGKFDLKYLNLNEIKKVLPQIQEYFKNFPDNQKINVQVSASESKVPNQSGFGIGDLAEKRGETITNYLKTILPKNANYLPVNNLGAVGPEWDTNKGKNFSGYTKSQTISIDLNIDAEKKETIDCLVDLKISLDYRRDWCYATPRSEPNQILFADESKCHACDEAVFILYANNIPLSPSINLNNGNDTESRSGTVTITKEMALKILGVKKDITLSIGCALNGCHADHAHLTITNNKGEELFKGFVTHGAQRLGPEPKYLMLLNSCGEVIDKSRVVPWKQSGEKGRVILARKNLWKFDAYNPIKSYADVYRAVNKDGIIKGPKFRGIWDGKTWEEFKEYFRLKNKDIKNIEEYIQQNPQ